MEAMPLGTRADLVPRMMDRMTVDFSCYDQLARRCGKLPLKYDRQVDGGYMEGAKTTNPEYYSSEFTKWEDTIVECQTATAYVKIIALECEA